MIITEYRARVNKTKPEHSERDPTFLLMVFLDAAQKTNVYKYFPVENKWELNPSQVLVHPNAVVRGHYHTLVIQNELFSIWNWNPAADPMVCFLTIDLVSSIFRKTYSHFQFKDSECSFDGYNYNGSNNVSCFQVTVSSARNAGSSRQIYSHHRWS